jgi:hypothetical protein
MHENPVLSHMKSIYTIICLAHMISYKLFSIFRQCVFNLFFFFLAKAGLRTARVKITIDNIPSRIHFILLLCCAQNL